MKETYDPPLILFFKGDPALLRTPQIGIVGARAAAKPAAEWTEGIASTLARCGFTVTSGMARGIDGAAHRGALRAGGGTIAVLGTGPDVVYPEEHDLLTEEVARDGLVVTEQPPGAGPLREHFPRRNRIVAGLSAAVVVIQASAKSGALITARLALEANRELFVLAAPPWDKRFAGNRRLALQGAPAVQDGGDIALRLGVTPPEEAEECPAPGPSIEKLRGREKAVASLLEEGPRSADEICRAIDKGVAEVLPLLLSLEVGGFVEELPGNLYGLAGAR